MVIVKGDSRTEAGVLPTEAELTTMGKYNQQLIDAGVMVDGAGLQPTSKGARVGFKNGQVYVTDGPFAETEGNPRRLLDHQRQIESRSHRVGEEDSVQLPPEQRSRCRGRDSPVLRN
jgi:hypothetical protein